MSRQSLHYFAQNAVNDSLKNRFVRVPICPLSVSIKTSAHCWISELRSCYVIWNLKEHCELLYAFWSVVVSLTGLTPCLFRFRLRRGVSEVNSSALVSFGVAENTLQYVAAANLRTNKTHFLKQTQCWLKHTQCWLKHTQCWLKHTQC